MPEKSRQVELVAHIPVVHRGYIEFFNAFPDAEVLHIIGSELCVEADKELDYLRKDLRALTPQQAQRAVQGLQRFRTISILEAENIADLDTPQHELVFPDEDISRIVASRMLQATISFHPVFLRWDRRSVEGIDAQDDEVSVTQEELHQKIMAKAFEGAGLSSDIWRRVGAVLVEKDSQLVAAAYNRGEPTPSSPLMEGDPRNIFKRGVGIEMSVFSHAEAVLIAEAAKQGVSLKGSKLYVTTFPCPACAKLIAHSGISHCYFAEGYAVLDGKRVLEENDVALIKVVGVDSEIRRQAWVPYKK